jgi:hypothetical protein
MCLKCLRFRFHRRVSTPEDFYRCIDWLRPFVADGTLEVVRGSIDAIPQRAPARGGYMIFFQCPKCEWGFWLVGDTEKLGFHWR